MFSCRAWTELLIGILYSYTYCSLYACVVCFYNGGGVTKILEWQILAGTFPESEELEEMCCKMNFRCLVLFNVITSSPICEWWTLHLQNVLGRGCKGWLLTKLLYTCLFEIQFFFFWKYEPGFIHENLVEGGNPPLYFTENVRYWLMHMT